MAEVFLRVISFSSAAIIPPSFVKKHIHPRAHTHKQNGVLQDGHRNGGKGSKKL
jgi:hypothetical protein